MSRRPIALALLLLAAACNNGSAGPAFRLDQPSALAVFWGYAHKNRDAQGNAKLHPYVAVANSAKDELVLLDPVDDEVVASPVLIRPLSIPTPDPRPALLASTRFADEAVGDRAAMTTTHSDLLVVVSQGDTRLQLVRTWPGSVRDPGLAEDAPVDLGGQVQALLATPAVDASGALVAGRAWVVAALVDGRLAVVEYELDTSGGADEIRAVTGVPAYQVPAFRPLSLAVDPRATASSPWLYAASLDPIDGAALYGVGRFDLRGAPGSWPVAALDAHAPTNLVAAFTLRERRLDRRGTYDQIAEVDAESVEAFQDDAVERVYAHLDPASCGPRTAQPCGIAVLDPSTGDVLEDPWNPGQTPKRYLEPINLPAQPVALALGEPPANAPDTDTTAYKQDPYMYFYVAGQRLTTGMLLVPSEDGRSYLVDLARWEVPSASYEVYFSNGQETQVSSFRPSTTNVPQIRFFCPLPDDEEGICQKVFLNTPYTTTATAARFIRLMPGFTPTDLWSVTYQGTLPAFASKHVSTIERVSGSGSSAVYQVALQTSDGNQVVAVYNPEYGARTGDTVEFWTAREVFGSTCPDTPATTADVPIYPIEGRITAVLKPDAAHRGGSLLVAVGDCVPVLDGASTACDGATHGPWTSLPDCWGALEGTSTPVTIRARGEDDAGNKVFVVVGSGTGYAGRAASVDAAPAQPAFAFTNDGEADLVAACPLLPWPSDPLTAADCDDACRLTCEQATVARRARRNHRTSVVCNALDGACSPYYFPGFEAKEEPPAPFPPPTGPVLAFTVGWTTENVSSLRQTMVRDTQVIFATRSGYSPASRYGAGVNGGAGTHPVGAAYFDRSANLDWDKRKDGYRFFVPYATDVILDVSPAHANSSSKLLR